MSKYLGPRDIASSLSPDEEKMRRARGWRGAQNYRLAYTDYCALDWYKFVTRRLAGKDRIHAIYKDHTSARAVRRRIGDAAWSEYFTFAVDRNPWDKVVSGYCWFYGDRGARGRASANAPSFENYVRSGESGRLSAYNGYTERDQLIVDRLLRYEDLQTQLAEVASEIGLPDIPSIDRSDVNAKGGLRPSKDYRSYYTEELRDIVAGQFAPEIKLMSYTF